MAFFFIPLQAIVFSGLTPDQLPAASGLSNFVRITAGAMGTSIFTTLWEDRAILHHAQLAEQVNRQPRSQPDAGAARRGRALTRAGRRHGEPAGRPAGLHHGRHRPVPPLGLALPRDDRGGVAGPGARRRHRLGDAGWGALTGGRRATPTKSHSGAGAPTQQTGRRSGPGIDRDGDGKLPQLELVDRLHAEVIERHDAGGTDGFGQQVGAADGCQVAAPCRRMSATVCTLRSAADHRQHTAPRQDGSGRICPSAWRSGPADRPLRRARHPPGRRSRRDPGDQRAAAGRARGDRPGACEPHHAP